ncbi:hypothetical protein [Pelomicrobium methylotrophicum]|uniref:Uncharacterized protein n=1 Tax=Pelomicrobium methylotrophicum TaxID=2602750 RepID=A0A5C7EP34_9PROT|nr:hypothetical protein [Pelomicrobium methylotrophicum]TXF13625.1 hypothetical protein FR698_00465 [Pelomicrobium methylotrophicum]
MAGSKCETTANFKRNYGKSVSLLDGLYQGPRTLGASLTVLELTGLRLPMRLPRTFADTRQRVVTNLSDFQTSSDLVFGATAGALAHKLAAGKLVNEDDPSLRG